MPQSDKVVEALPEDDLEWARDWYARNASCVIECLAQMHGELRELRAATSAERARDDAMRAVEAGKPIADGVADAVARGDYASAYGLQIDHEAREYVAPSSERATMPAIEAEDYPYRLRDGYVVDTRGRRITVPGNLGIAQLLNTIVELRGELRAANSATSPSKEHAYRRAFVLTLAAATAGGWLESDPKMKERVMAYLNSADLDVRGTTCEKILHDAMGLPTDAERAYATSATPAATSAHITREQFDEILRKIGSRMGGHTVGSRDFGGFDLALRLLALVKPEECGIQVRAEGVSK